jgi:hypothetical protein
MGEIFHGLPPAIPALSSSIISVQSFIVKSSIGFSSKEGCLS